MADELINIPQDLTLVSDGDLAALEQRAVQEFDRVNGPDAEATPDGVAYGMQLADDIDRIRAEITARNARASQEAAQARAKLVEQRETLQTRVHGRTETEGTGEVQASVDAAEIARATAEGTAAAIVAAMNSSTGRTINVTDVQERATSALSAARRHAPAVVASSRPLSVQAGVDIPGVARGSDLMDLNALVDAFHRRARGLPVTRGAPSEQLVATIRNEFEHTVDDRTQPGQVEELFRFLTSPDKRQALVAGGGWCAPSETRYDFFNIACESGVIDLPTFGVTRGGIRFPVSPSLADADLAPFVNTFDNTSNPWLWTEDDDTATVTGSPNKPCIRVPCPDFDEERLECYGVCLTAGNLTDDAYPEATANFLRLLMAAHSHAMNARIIANMVALSSAAITTGEFDVENPAFQQVLGGIALAATDYRARYGMCEDDVLEVVAPYWLKEVIRADLRWRQLDSTLSVTDAQINSFFADINVRVQWVNDWQVRGAGQFGNATEMTAWPVNATVMIYAAGTFLLGNGLTLDLGVVRDSALNAENDHTAAWSEECHLVARVGHESRQYNIDFNVNGAISAGVTLGANL